MEKVRRKWGLTPRSKGAPTAGHQGPAGGTLYIFANRALASCRWRPLSSHVRPRTPSPFRPRRFGGDCMHHSGNCGRSWSHCSARAPWLARQTLRRIFWPVGCWRFAPFEQSVGCGRFAPFEQSVCRAAVSGRAAVLPQRSGSTGGHFISLDRVPAPPERLAKECPLHPPASRLCPRGRPRCLAPGTARLLAPAACAAPNEA